MSSIRNLISIAMGFALVLLGAGLSARAHAESALLLEEPYGFFGTLNPTGHNAIYFERICAESPIKLRRCQPGEMGVVIARYQGIKGYDWVAIPLIPYLYSVENVANVPVRVDRNTVQQLRNRYREEHLDGLGERSPGNLVRGGWTQLVGAAYERRIYVFRFHTTAEQDDALIEKLNAGPNHSNFNLLFDNCADFARVVMNQYFPHTFHRSIFPDAGMTTPKQITFKLARYAHKHPETQLTVFEIPQVPGYRRESHPIKGIDESLATTAYAVPIVLLNPYIAGGLFVDYMVRGRYHIIPKDHQHLQPSTLYAALAEPAAAGVTSAGVAGQKDSSLSVSANAGTTEKPAAIETNNGASTEPSSIAEPSIGTRASSAAPAAQTQPAVGASHGLKGKGDADE